MARKHRELGRSREGRPGIGITDRAKQGSSAALRGQDSGHLCTGTQAKTGNGTQITVKTLIANRLVDEETSKLSFSCSSRTAGQGQVSACSRLVYGGGCNGGGATMGLGPRRFRHVTKGDFVGL